MIINDFHVIRFPSTELPDLYGIATQVQPKHTIAMNNGRSVIQQNLIIFKELNPNGLMTKEELESYCSGNCFEQDCSLFISSKERKVKDSKGNSFALSDFLVQIRKSFLSSMDVDSIKKTKGVSTYEFTANKNYSICYINLMDDIPAYVHTISERHPSFEEIEIGGHYLWEEQRKEAEKDFYLIRIDINAKQPQYIIRKQKHFFSFTESKCWARQFSSENEAFRYTERYADIFGTCGYEVEKVKGMTMEEGLGL